MAFQIAFTRYPEYANSIDKLYTEVSGRKRRFEIIGDLFHYNFLFM